MNLQITGNNMNGSPQLSLSDGNNTTFAWSPFGGSATRTGITASLPGFNSERQDPLSGVTHLGNGYRAYSPALRRFTCPDCESPFGVGGINPYVYCNHDPVNNTDPSGHMPKGKAAAKAKTRRRRRRLDLSSRQAESLPTSLPQPTLETSGTASAAAAASGYSSEVAAPAALHDDPSASRPGLLGGGNEDVESVNSLDQRLTTIPSYEGEAEEFAQFDSATNYAAWNELGAPRNIAFMDFDLESEGRGTLFSISGQRRILKAVKGPGMFGRQFKFLTVGHTRAYDSELKLAEAFVKLFPDKNIKGVISIHSELPICKSCKMVIEQLKNKYPHLKVYTHAQGSILRRR
ncbi:MULTISPECIES: RHS repeat-associated core domain-containing protein [Klebsiella]|nr:RHS repeat-associated core domain-containing protein [Klebsiella pasteurii]MDX7158056.1 RHS repeat-associated core domain-containing protein [Klebsiella pasteurii]VUS55886.1 hypothetical protein SB6415_00047 [Klebsiella pasteurii]VUT14761.1 hypothetical protein SB6413_01850 [Klebsiella pasteurii]